MSHPDSAHDLIDHLYETSVDPERLFDLIRAWDARIGGSDPERAVMPGGLGSTPFVRHVERALAVLDEVHALEFRKLDDVLAGIPSAAMVLTEAGIVVAANEPARVGFGMYPGGSIRLLPVSATERADLADRVATVALGPELRDDIVELRPEGRARSVRVHLRTLGAGTARRHALAVSSEQVWIEAVGDVLTRVFALTGAEVALFRRLTEGETVADICQATGRTEGTVRSQLHSVLAKTGARTQVELARLATMLLHAVAFDPPARPGDHAGPLALDRHTRHLRLADGRKLAVLRFGDPAGHPVLWMHSSMGLFQPTRSAELALRRRKLKIIVPIRAGYGSSDPAPAERDPLDVAVADAAELMTQAGIERCPVVAAWYEIRAGLMLAHAAPERVVHIVGIGAAFPIRRIEQFRRLQPAGRVFVACARYMPQALPFLARAARTRMLRSGVDEYVQATYRETPADARAFMDPEIADAVIAAFTRLHADYGRPEDAFGAELVRCQQPWPARRGDVGCPLTLIHGEQDGTAPHLTALDYCATYPRWRYIGFPDAGQLVALVRWREVLDVIEHGPDAVPASPATAFLSAP